MVKRKWLVKSLPTDETKYTESIDTCYISFKPEVKLKKVVIEGIAHYYLIVRNIGIYKKVEINKFNYEELVKTAISKTLSKVRTKLNIGKLVVSVDAYSNFAEKLTMANIAFKSEDESDDFIPPAWFGREVTDVENFKTKNLSVLDL